jgi:hypothetical protein
MSAVVPSFVWFVVFATAVLAIVALVLALERYGGTRGGAVALGAGAALAGWFALAVAASAAGAFVAAAGQPPTIGLGVFPPIVIGGAVLAASRAVRRAIVAVPRHVIVSIQTMRVAGVVFVVLYGRGLLPPQFALPAGWGDFTVGAAAPLVALALARSKPWARGLALAWNALGILDLAVAVTMGALSADSAVRVFTSGPSTTAMAQLPLSMVPVFAVPLFMLLHFVSIAQLRSGPESARGELRLSSRLPDRAA